MKNLIKLFIPVLICSFSMLSQLNACSCMEIPEIFLNDFHKGELVIHVKILEHEAPPEITHSMLQSTSKLKVLNVLNGNLKSDIVYFVSGTSAACKANIEDIDVGTEMILKPGKLNGEKDKNKIYLNGNICSRWVMPIKDGRVLGMVTKNRMKRRYKKMKKYYNKGDEKSMRRWKELSEKPLKIQRIRIKKLKKILSKK